ncbi:MAG: acyl-CoA reductase [Thermonemataceae bacterium]
MDLMQRKQAFVELGNSLQQRTEEEKAALYQQVYQHNTWFTPESIEQALEGSIRYLQPAQLEAWLSRYTLPEVKTPQKVGVVMAGNIPAVGFHDLLCVLISGHTLLAKPSSQDQILISFLAKSLCEIAPAFSEYIHFPPLLKEAEVFIATGSDNTARYFEYYFRDKPHLIRKNRVGVGVMRGDETAEDHQALAQDIFTYFGLGCRNIAKVFVPAGYDFIPFYDAIASFEPVTQHHKYRNNYDYNKAIYLVKKLTHLDNGFLLVREEQALASPVAVLFYETYLDQKDLAHKLATQKDKLQCIVSKEGWYADSLPFGKAQQPQVWEYADQVDTLRFLSTLT